MTPDERTAHRKAKRAEYGRKYREKHADQLKARRALYREENREALRKADADYRAANKEERARRQSARHAERMQDPTYAERRRERSKTWYATHTDGVVKHYEKKFATRRERYANDDNYRMRQRIHSDMWKVTRGTLKSGRMFDLLGCSIEHLSAYTESLFLDGMSFDNLGEWELDHVRPLYSFDLTDEAQLREACHYTNLRPLWRQDNRGRRL